METFLFGPGDRLFGAYYEGFGLPTAPAVLICNGLGQDYMRSHFVLRHLARRLSAEGGSVLQFDYRGTGDSLGEPQGNTLAGLREDAATALQELVDISGRSRVVTVGVRFGAWLALELSDRVVAWDPVLSGEHYVASLQTLARGVCKERNVSSARQNGTDSSTELAGYRYADRLLEELAGLSLPQILDQREYRHLALISGDEVNRDEVSQTLEGHSDDLVVHAVSSAQWNSVSQLERSLTPFPSLARLCEQVSRW